MKKPLQKKNNLRLVNSLEKLEGLLKIQKNKVKKPEAKKLKEIYQLSSLQMETVAKEAESLENEVKNDFKRKQDFQELDAFFEEIRQVYS